MWLFDNIMWLQIERKIFVLYFVDCTKLKSQISGRKHESFIHSIIIFFFLNIFTLLFRKHMFVENFGKDFSECVWKDIYWFYNCGQAGVRSTHVCSSSNAEFKQTAATAVKAHNLLLKPFSKQSNVVQFQKLKAHNRLVESTWAFKLPEKEKKMLINNFKKSFEQIFFNSICHREFSRKRILLVFFCYIFCRFFFCYFQMVSQENNECSKKNWNNEWKKLFITTCAIAMRKMRNAFVLFMISRLSPLFSVK